MKPSLINGIAKNFNNVFPLRIFLFLKFVKNDTFFGNGKLLCTTFIMTFIGAGVSLWVMLLSWHLLVGLEKAALYGA